MSFQKEGSWVLPKLGVKQTSTYVTGDGGDPTFQLVLPARKKEREVTLECRLVFSSSEGYLTFVSIHIPEIHFRSREFSVLKPGGDAIKINTELRPCDFPPGELTIRYRITHENIIMSGLQNRRYVSTTCYMNSILQMLFHVPLFRKMIFELPVTEERARFEKITRGLQLLYTRMMSPGVHSTNEFTESLGWPKSARLIQHDAIDFLVVLMNYLEKNCPVYFQEKLHDMFYTTVEGKDGTYRMLNFDLALTRKKKLGFVELINNSIMSEDVRVLRFPKILFFHLDRATLKSKSDIACEFPDELDMNEVLKGSGKYRLHAIVLHCGKVSIMGHYFLLSRPSMIRQWFRYYDAIAEPLPVKDQTVVESYGVEGKPAATILMYVSEEYEKEIYCVETIVPAFADQYLKEEASRKEEVEPRLTKKIYIATDDDIATACEKGIPNAESINPKLTFDVPATATRNDIYEIVGESIGMKVDSFNLRHSSDMRNPTRELVRRTDSKNVLQKTGSSCFFYLETDIETEEAKRVDTRTPIVLAEFNPLTCISVTSTKYLGRLAVSNDKPISDFISDIKLLMDKPDLDDSSIALFLDGEKIDVTKNVDYYASSIAALGNFFIVQDLSIGHDCDFSVKDQFTSYYKVSEAIGMPARLPYEFPQYLTMKNNAIDVTFYKLGDSNVKFRMRLPLSNILTTALIKDIIKNVTNDHALCLYLAYDLHCIRQNEMKGSLKENVNKDFDRDLYIYYKVHSPSSGSIVRVGLSENGVTTDVVHEICVPLSTTIADLVRAVDCDWKDCKVTRIVDSYIDSICPLTSVVIPRSYYRIDRVIESARYIKVNYGTIFNDTLYVVKFGQPFLLPVIEGESVAEMKSRLVALVGKDPETFDIIVTDRGEKIVADSIETLENLEVLTILMKNVDSIEYFDARSYFTSGIRFMN